MTATRIPDQDVLCMAVQGPIRVDQENHETAGRPIRRFCKTAGREIRHRSDQKSDQKAIRAIRKIAKPQVEKSEKRSDKSDTRRSENRTPLYRRGAVCRHRPDGRKDDTVTAHILYRFYSADHRLLYIGITADPPARFRSHGSTKQWWAEVAAVHLEHHRDRDALAAAERAAIRSERPRYNITHNGAQRPFDGISEAMLGSDTTWLPFWIDVATAPWFGTCPGCTRELGHPEPETVAKLNTTGQPAYRAPGPWHCLPCLGLAMREEVRFWAAERRAALGGTA